MQVILRSNYQCLVWKDSNVTTNLLSPEEYGWVKRNAIYEEITTTLPQTPDALVNLVKCVKSPILKCIDIFGCSVHDECGYGKTINDL